MRSTVNRTEAAAKRGQRPTWLRPALLLVAVVGMAVSAPLLGLGERLAALRGWIEGLGTAGPLVFALLYAAATAAGVPASLLTVAAGAMFGSLVGVATVLAGATAGAAAAFAIARYLARDAVAAWLGKSERFARLDDLTERHGAIIVAITRLVPLFPFNLLNYGFGLTRVRFGTYLVWSFVCMLPGTALYVVGADALTQGVAEGRAPWALLGVLAGVVLVLSVAVHRARRALAAREARAVTSDEPAR